jgi:hypothetical protein
MDVRRIKGCNLLLHRHRELRRFRRRADCEHLEIGTTCVAFKDGKVHGRRRVFSSLVQGVADFAHNFVINVVGHSNVEMHLNMQVLADGTITR